MNPKKWSEKCQETRINSSPGFFTSLTLLSQRFVKEEVAVRY
jgi:hypothetical protein